MTERPSPPEPLRPRLLRRRCDLRRLPFADTTELPPPTRFLGQERAVEALRTCLGIPHPGYNLFALGPLGVGRHTVVARFLAERARAQPAPPGWVYVHDFDDPRRPRAIPLPPGQARRFARDMERFVADLPATIAAALESDAFRARARAIEAEVKREPEARLDAVRKEADRRGILMMQSPAGVAFAATRDGKVVDPEAFAKLPPAERARIERDIAELEERLAEVMRGLPAAMREGRRRLAALRREAITAAVAQPLDELRQRYHDRPGVMAHLDAVLANIVEVAEAGTLPDAPPPPPRTAQAFAHPFHRYRANLLVDHAPGSGAPVIYEEHPTHQNLLGEIEHISQAGALVTDVSLVEAGALHRANGGYLLLDARRLLLQPYAWEALKRAIRGRQVRIASLAHELGLTSTATLEPQPIPLAAKVVLVGERRLYDMLCRLDPEFGELFKIAADFAEEVDWTPETVPELARLAGALAASGGLRPLERRAVARVVEEASRMAGDRRKLSVRVERLADLLREANHVAAARGLERIDAAAVEEATGAQRRRQGRIPDLVREAMLRGTLLVDTEGSAVGQVNGLSVVSVGPTRFGRPSRITATVQLGKGEVVDIEREVELGGPLHTKGVMILAGFLGARFGARRPLPVSARLVFEQSYGGVDGDSASSAELYALLSALAKLPLRQDLAVTGSVNQHGRVQAIGGVNEKIEGFFDLCRARGLTGSQGVLIPRANVDHLMLRPDVVRAARRGRFHVYAVATVDEGIALLTGRPAGERGRGGRYPKESVNGRVEARLAAFARAARRAAAGEKRERTGRGDGG